MMSGHMMFVVGAFALLSLVTLGVNSIILEKTTVMLDTEASITAISISQAMIDEIQSKAYDEKTLSVRVYNTADMTPTDELGPEAGEAITYPDVYPYASVTTFDDADDYNRYRRTVTTTRLGDFTVLDSVYYVTDSNLDVRSFTQTFYKKIVVTVTHPNMKVPVVLTDVLVYRRYI
jgi:hypothetical protein